MAELREQLQSALGTAYTIERELGGGGMSRVFLAADNRLKRQVVAKVLAPELAAGISAERFEREIQLAAALQHPNIVPVLTAGDVDGLPYYTMPYVAGASLRQRLHDVPPASRAELLDILRDAAKALAYAHRQGVVHRDIKPENILVNEGAAVVTDFGIAKAVSASKTGAPGGTLTSIGASLGTPAYMAPEQAAGDTVDHRADIYSWGIVAYEALAGRHPFADRTTAQQLIAAHISETPKALATVAMSVPPALSALVMRCIEKDPSRRPQSAAELAADLEGARSGPAPIGTMSSRSRRGVALASAAVAVIAIAAVAWALRGRSSVQADERVIAVVPFRVAGADPALHYLREGMLDLIAAKLSVGDDVRAVDSRTLLAAWKRVGGSESTDPDVERTLRMAAGVGAGDLLSGEVVGTPARFSITARIASTADGRVRARGTVEGPADSLTALVDRLSAQLLSLRAGESERDLASLTSTSHDALRQYLEGRRLYRAGRILPAGERFAAALERDSNFARAALGLAMVGQWGAGFRFARAGEDATFRLRGRMSPLDRLYADMLVGDEYPRDPLVARAIEASERLLAREPDSPEALSTVADQLFHFGHYIDRANSLTRARDLWMRMLSLDSTFLNHVSHFPALLVELGDTAGLERVARIVERDTANAYLAPPLRLASAVVRNDTAARRRFLTELPKWETRSLAVAGHPVMSERCPECRIAAVAAFRGQATTDAQRNFARTSLAELHLLAGQPARADSMLGDMPRGPPSIYVHAFADGDSAGAARAAERLAAEVPTLTPSRRLVTAHLALGVHGAVRGDTAATRRALEALRATSVSADSIDLDEERDHAVLVLGAVLATSARSPAAAGMLAQLDSVQHRAPSGPAAVIAPFVLARGWERLGEPRKALASLQAVPRDWGGTAAYAATRARELGRIASSIGERDEALQAYERYLRWRRAPEPHLRAEREAVLREVQRLEGARR